MKKRALIYGISGQDGYYLSKLLSSKGYMVAGASQSGLQMPSAQKVYMANFAGSPKDYIFPIDDFEPDEIYNLAGISNPRIANAEPQAAFKINSEPVEAILKFLLEKKSSCGFFQASSAYMFGGSGNISEKSLPAPFDVYGESKLRAHIAVGEYRHKGIFACSGILFNHESPLRPHEFVTRKITSAAAAFSLGKKTGLLELGNLDAMRDWGFAGDYVEAMWLMLQQKKSNDYVIATGEQHTVREFCIEAFSHVGLDYNKYVSVNKDFMRSKELTITADTTAINTDLGWKPKVSFKQLVHMMVDEDVNILQKGGSS